MPASGRPQSCPTHVRRPLLYFYSLSIFYSIPYASTIVFDFYSIYDTFFILVYIDSIYTASLMYVRHLLQSHTSIIAYHRVPEPRP